MESAFGAGLSADARWSHANESEIIIVRDHRVPIFSLALEVCVLSAFIGVHLRLILFSNAPRKSLLPVISRKVLRAFRCWIINYLAILRADH